MPPTPPGAGVRIALVADGGYLSWAGDPAQIADLLGWSRR